MKHFIISLFNLKEKDIFDIEIQSLGNESFVFITLRSKEVVCPACKTTTSKIHDYRERTINHPIFSTNKTTFIYNQRRYVCRECGKRFSELNPFTSPGRRISKLTIIRVMQALENPKVTYDMAAKASGLSATTAQHIFDTHVGIKTIPFPKVLCCRSFD